MQDEQLERAVQRAAESLYEDESLRSNMADSEANLVLQWGNDWIESKLRSAFASVQIDQLRQDELARVKGAIRAFNTLAARRGDLRLADAISEFESPLQVQSFNRDQVFKLLTVLTSAVWEMRAEQSNAADPNAMVVTEE